MRRGAPWLPLVLGQSKSSLSLVSRSSSWSRSSIAAYEVAARRNSTNARVMSDVDRDRGFAPDPGQHRDALLCETYGAYRRPPLPFEIAGCDLKAAASLFS
jgi:hypothetical protein